MSFYCFFLLIRLVSLSIYHNDELYTTVHTYVHVFEISEGTRQVRKFMGVTTCKYN